MTKPSAGCVVYPLTSWENRSSKMRPGSVTAVPQCLHGNVDVTE